MAKNLLNSMTNTKTRTLVIFLGVLVLIAIFFVFFRSSSEVDPLEEKASRTAAVPSSIKAIPGNEVPEKYRELQIEENRQRVIEAYQKKTSAIPTIVGSVSTSELNDRKDALLNAQKGSDLGNIFGDTQRGGFVGKGTTQRGPTTASIQAREDKIEKEKERVKQIREDRERQKELDRQRKENAQAQARYADSIKQTTKSMQKHASGIFSNWTKFNEQDFVIGVLGQEEISNANKKDNGPLILAPGTKVGKNKVVAADGTIVNKEYIKAGSVLFAVIETAVNTDEPSPIMATVVSGKYKGGKLLGSVQHSSRQEKVVLSFDTLSLPKHDNSMSVKAVAIDQDTARTALASDVDHHYLLRYGSLFAASFMEGYGKAISDQGSTTITSPTGTITSTKADLSGSEQIYSALGEVGKQWSKQTEKLFDTPYTVTIDQGLGIGVLFLKDVDVTNPELTAATVADNTSATGTVNTSNTQPASK